MFKSNSHRWRFDSQWWQVLRWRNDRRPWFSLLIPNFNIFFQYFPTLNRTQCWHSWSPIVESFSIPEFLVGVQAVGINQMKMRYLELLKIEQSILRGVFVQARRRRKPWSTQENFIDYSLLFSLRPCERILHFHIFQCISYFYKTVRYLFPVKNLIVCSTFRYNVKR